MGSDNRKRMRRLVRAVEKTAGWDVELTSGNHYKFTAPSGRSCFGPSTPSDHHSARRVLIKLQALGWKGRLSG